ncbi:MAG TPA: hypothetical protein VOA19_10620 [Actinomycetes bacterium]|nr:hypothetical protein [Actinomycetes bacterium]
MIGTVMIGTRTDQPQDLVEDQIVCAALAAVELALERSQTARTESVRRRELAQVRGTLSTLPSGGFSLEGGLRYLIGALGNRSWTSSQRSSGPADRR